MMLDEFRVFFETIQAGSIRAASERLNVAPSSVSRQIRTVERQMGVQLFDRTQSGVVPTEAGRLLATFARGALLDFESLKSDLSQGREIKKGHIRIAAVASATTGHVARLIATFRRRFPGITFSLTVLPAQKVIEAIKAAQVDIGFTYCAQPDTSLTQLVQFVEPTVLACPLDHSVIEYRKKGISIYELSKLPLALPDESFGVRRILDIASAREGVKIAPVLVSDSLEALKSFVLQGSAYAVLPAMSFEQERRAGSLELIKINVPSLSNATVDVITLSATRHSRVIRLFLQSILDLALQFSADEVE